MSEVGPSSHPVEKDVSIHLSVPLTAMRDGTSLKSTRDHNLSAHHAPHPHRRPNDASKDNTVASVKRK